MLLEILNLSKCQIFYLFSTPLSELETCFAFGGQLTFFFCGLRLKILGGSCTLRYVFSSGVTLNDCNRICKRIETC